MSAWAQRLAAAAVLLVAGLLSLPLSAMLLDRSTATENLILPAQLIAMAGLGAVLAALWPALAPGGASRTRRLLVGAAWGLLAAVLGVAVFWLMLNGLHGA